jgi:hypothetical protein
MLHPPTDILVGIGKFWNGKKDKVRDYKTQKKIESNNGLMESTSYGYDEMRNHSLDNRLLLSESFGDTQHGVYLEPMDFMV